MRGWDVKVVNVKVRGQVYMYMHEDERVGCVKVRLCLQRL